MDDNLPVYFCIFRSTI